MRHSKKENKNSVVGNQLPFIISGCIIVIVKAKMIKLVSLWAFFGHILSLICVKMCFGSGRVVASHHLPQC